MKKYKYITIKNVEQEKFEGRLVYRIYNNKNGSQLAILSYYKPWKQYVFSSREECVLNDSCLKDVLEFMNTLKNNF